MKKVGIPYEMREGKLNMPPVKWPVRCPCCGSDKVDGQFKLEHKAREVRSSSTTSSSSSYYPLEWQVPYCEVCKAHAARTTTLLVISVLLVLILPIVLAIGLGVVSDSMSVILLIAGSIMFAMILYQVLLRVMVFPKMTKSCAHYREAIFVTDDEKSMVFHFYRDDQAGLFAQANNSGVLDDIKPSFWSMKRK